MTFTATAIFVQDVETSRNFYEEVLSQKVTLESKDVYVAFESGLALWQTKFATETIFGVTKKFDGQSFEICFESETIEEAFKKACDAGAGIISKIEPQPWGQMVFRMFDPDGHIIEVAEPLAHSIQRFADSGMSHEQISEVTHIPLEMVKNTLEE
jgi:catechol 2,3-dioxygenase-like lactoylglutathione lyase family enzyme